ncbi:DUF3152 domain-containing protein [Micromonospora sp. SH-82]|uniref:DUF3152 domain-containing protein n=1 Tax=Micromonospora sp. SH-82 TaxID=3132938 RepID=UPI003EB9EAC8
MSFLPALPARRLLPVLVLAVALVLAVLVVSAPSTDPSTARSGGSGGAPPGLTSPSAAVPSPSAGLSSPSGGDRGSPGRPGIPTFGTGTFVTADGGTPVRGDGGPLHRYRVAVEAGVGQDVATFAATVDEALADPRGWTADATRRVQRVAEPAEADFTVYLASPATSEQMCALGGLSTERYTSCRLPGQVIVNLARWLEAVPDYGAPLEVYRSYVINHEVGHEFGYGHEACPGPGRPAPVMQQQTYGLDGCVAYAWPYLDGRRYAGDPVDGI